MALKLVLWLIKFK